MSVSCLIASGDVPLSIHWLHNNKSLDEEYFGSGINILKTGKRSSVLTIDAVHAGHVGQYTCRAENRAGSTQHSVQLVVNG